jgi:hypothetical protein
VNSAWRGSGATAAPLVSGPAGDRLDSWIEDRKQECFNN